MARLYEYQSKELLKKEGIPVPGGAVVRSAEEAYEIASKLGKPVVLKAQVWVTGRAGLGGIQFAGTPDVARDKARNLLGKKIKNFVVEAILVEEKLSIEKEFFAGMVIDDSKKKPVLIFSTAGGTGIEEIAREHPDRVFRIPVNVREGLREYQIRNILRRANLSGKILFRLSDSLTRLYWAARKFEARSIEVNPLVLTKSGRIVAADCHMAIDDYAVFRHPELRIEVAREFDRPPSELEKIAYKVEEKDYRGTFYFFQMLDDIRPKDKAIGFHGAGGGGSMMSMDAVLKRDFKLANYCDTSGNPPAGKVYRAAKIILSQPGIVGYFASGSGVASQEQYHSARGFVKAFLEESLSIPAVIRLGGNYEEAAVNILHTYLKKIPAVVEGYKKNDSPEFCAQRLENLVNENKLKPHQVRLIQEPDLSGFRYSFETFTGEIFIDHQKCENCRTKGCLKACPHGILKLDDNGYPVLALSREEVKKGKCTECLACEIFCKFHEQDALFIYLPIPGLKEYRGKVVEIKNKEIH